MRSFRLVPGALCAFALTLAFVARADDPKPTDAKPVTLAYTYKEKDATGIKTETKGEISNIQFTSERKGKRTVKELKKTGETVILIEGLEGHYSAAGMEGQIPVSPVITMTLDKTGKIAS